MAARRRDGADATLWDAPRSLAGVAVTAVLSLTFGPAAASQPAPAPPTGGARLLGGAGHVAEMLAENPLPLAHVASLVMAMRRRMEAALGTAASAAAETAGGRLPVPALLDLALDGLTS